LACEAQSLAAQRCRAARSRAIPTIRQGGANQAGARAGRDAVRPEPLVAHRADAESEHHAFGERAQCLELGGVDEIRGAAAAQSGDLAGKQSLSGGRRLLGVVARPESAAASLNPTLSNSQ